MERPTLRTIPRLYYLMTPAFILLDYAAGVNVRTAALDGMPLQKNLYYGFCVLCGVIVFVAPRASAVVAIFESIIIVLITMLSMLRPIIEALEQVANLEGDWRAAETIGFEGGTNVLMATMIAVIAFRSALAAVAAVSDKAARGEDHAASRRGN